MLCTEFSVVQCGRSLSAVFCLALPCHACVPCLQAKSLESDISLQSHYTKIFLAFRAPLHRNILGGITLDSVINYITQKIVWELVLL